MIYCNYKTKSKVEVSQTVIKVYGSAEAFLKAISLFDFNFGDWTPNENRFNFIQYVDSINVELQISKMKTLSKEQLQIGLKQIEFRINDPSRPKDLQFLENEKLQRVVDAFKYF